MAVGRDAKIDILGENHDLLVLEHNVATHETSSAADLEYLKDHLGESSFIDPIDLKRITG